ncbi:hypothetical protein XENTR_v10017399 [Xenopus tropicalis]|nr:hypothetical protein XENTR_v10017399 [Xenopus tropicalis]
MLFCIDSEKSATFGPSFDSLVRAGGLFAAACRGKGAGLVGSHRAKWVASGPLCSKRRLALRSSLPLSSRTDR